MDLAPDQNILNSGKEVIVPSAVLIPLEERRHFEKVAFFANSNTMVAITKRMMVMIILMMRMMLVISIMMKAMVMIILIIFGL